MTLSQARQPIKTMEQYKFRLHYVYELLKLELRIGTRNYVKLGLSVVHINYYQNVNGLYFDEQLILLWERIFSLLKHPRKQKMQKRIGIELMVRYNRKYKLNRMEFRLLPAILPDRINFR